MLQDFFTNVGLSFSIDVEFIYHVAYLNKINSLNRKWYEIKDNEVISFNVRYNTRGVVWYIIFQISRDLPLTKMKKSSWLSSFDSLLNMYREDMSTLTHSLNFRQFSQI